MSKFAILAVVAAVLLMPGRKTEPQATASIPTDDCQCVDCQCAICDCQPPIVPPVVAETKVEPSTASVGRVDGVVVEINGQPAIQVGDGQYLAGGKTYRLQSSPVVRYSAPQAGTCRIVNGRIICE